MITMTLWMLSVALFIAASSTYQRKQWRSAIALYTATLAVTAIACLTA